MLPALIVCAVLAIDPAGLAPFGPAKWALVPALVLAAVASERELEVARRPLVAWSALLAIVAVAAVGALDPLYAWIGTPERRFGALTWLLCALAFAAGHARRAEPWLAPAAALAVGLTGMWSVAEMLGWEPVELVGAGDRPVGPLGSSAYSGAAMALLVPVALAHPARWARAAVGLGAIALVASGARAAWVGVLVAGIVWLLVRRPTLDARWIAGGALAVVGAAALTGVLGRVPDLVTDDRGGAAGRLDEWRVATRVIADRPLAGTGPEGYRIAFGRAVDDEYEIEHGREQLPDRAHSSVLDVAATIGIPGALAHVALLAVVGPFVGRALRRGDLVAAGVLAYGVQSLALFPIAELDPVAWALAGVTVGRNVVGAEVVRLRVGVPVRAVVGAVGVLAVVAGGLDVVADRRARSILDGRATNPSAAADLRPDALRYHLVAARAEERRGDLDAALDALDDALDVSPRDPIVRGERARLLLQVDVVAALAALEALVVDDPRNAEVLLRLGVARARTGDDDGAETAWLAAERLAPASTAARTNLERLYERRADEIEGT